MFVVCGLWFVEIAGAQSNHINFDNYNGYVNGLQTTVFCPGDSYEAKTTVELSNRTSAPLTYELWVYHDGDLVRHVFPTTLAPNSTSTLDLSVGAYIAVNPSHNIKAVAKITDSQGNLVGDGTNDIIFNQSSNCGGTGGGGQGGNGTPVEPIPVPIIGG